MFKELFLETDAEDRSAIVIKPATRHRQRQPQP